MPLHILLEPTSVLQTLVTAISIFNLVSFLWLALTVWLNGNRNTWIARLGVVGLSFSAFFFFLHALLVSTPLSQTSQSPLDFLWHLIWIPAVSVPYIWFAIGLHYAALINQGWRQRRPLLLLSSGILGGIILLLLLSYQSTFTFVGTLRLLAYSDLFNDNRAALFSPPVLLPVLFLFYVTFCAIGPWFTLGRVNRLLRVIIHTLHHPIVQRSPVSNTPDDSEQDSTYTPPLRRALSRAFWDNPPEVELLEEPLLSWHLARPGLFLAAILMVILTCSLGVFGIWSLSDWFLLHHTEHSPIASLPILTAIPFQLFVLDFFATGSVALIILLVGYSIVRHGILIERPLARRGFFKQWRGIVIVATAVALFIALLVTFTHSSNSLPALLLITSLATAAYALFTWSSYTAHDRYIALLGPFLRSTNMRHWLNTDLPKTEQGLEDLFFHLCKDVLAVQCARLTIIAGPIRRNFDYRWPDTTPLPEAPQVALATARDALRNTESFTGSIPIGSRSPTRIQLSIHSQPMICWILPIYDELGLVATLYLGPRQDGAAFTDEDMDLAHACSQRILDTLSDHEAMQAVAALLRRRIVDVKLLGAQQRRVLHDDILPQMHLALLRLETLRTHLGKNEQPNPTSSSPQQPSLSPEQVLDESVQMISNAHRSLAALMRTTAPGVPHRLERDGMMHAIHSMLEQDFQNAFDEVAWLVSEETARCIDDITPPAIAELIFAAVQEALRNAARHARGSDLHRPLRLTLKATCNRSDPCLEIVVSDDGVGIISASSSTTGTGGGLLTHSALLAIAGGTLTIKTVPNQGVTVHITLPPASLR